MGFTLLLLVVGLGWLFMAVVAAVTLADQIGWTLWALVGFAALMGSACLAWAIAGLFYRLKVARGGDRVEAIFARKQSDAGYTLNAAIRDLLAMGKKTEAINLHREVTHSGPDEARLYVEDIEKDGRR